MQAPYAGLLPPVIRVEIQNLDAVQSMLGEDEVTLLFLPLAHTLTKIIALVCVEWGTKVAFATNLGHLQEELPMAQPTLLVAVPRVFEKVFNSAQHKAAAEGHGKIFAKAEEVAIRWSEGHAAGRLQPVTGAERAVFEPLVYRKLQAATMRRSPRGEGPRARPVITGDVCSNNRQRARRRPGR